MPLDTDALLQARRTLAARDGALAHVDARLPPFAWRLRAGGFAGLMRLVTEQQLSTASAAAIWARVEAGLGQVTPQAVLAREAAELKAFGLSSPKVRYALAAAEAHAAGRIDFEALATLDDEAAVAALTAIKGVGRWTAELYLLFCEGRLDLFPAGDLALQEGLRLAEGETYRLNERALCARAETWRPYRGVAAHMIWGYYALAQRERAAARAPARRPPKEE